MSCSRHPGCAKHQIGAVTGCTECTAICAEHTYEGFVKFADGTVISLQCFEGHCRDCPDPHIGYSPVLDGYYCEHSCERTS